MSHRLRVGIIGTGAIAGMHARAYENIGYSVRVCTNVTADKGRAFAAAHGAEFVERFEDVCRHPDVDFVDVCTFPCFRLDVVRACAESGKPVQVQKPMATSIDIARAMVDIAEQAGIPLGVVSQHRFDRASLFLSSAINDGRLGKLLQCDAYVKWWRSDEYYARPVKGSWAIEGGGALINQAIHQVDLLLWFAGPVRELSAMWQIGAAHAIESEDIVNAVMRYESGATGVIQAATALWPGYSERVELHGTKGSAIITGDQLTTWDVKDDEGEAPPLSTGVASGASDPMAISVESFERQFLDFGDAIRTGRKPLVSGDEGYQALALVDAVYRSCRTGRPVYDLTPK
ncbi:MAG TPA: Gfo/Idh/MocA family oxidoreductase [Vicinamibacterales bacterium]|nr:Gfo/Idh/MocA family oxidoreductase [Vicinamibacterales bacterium]